jgi:type I restriction enzyme R subunit
MKTPEEEARERIDANLALAGWVVQDRHAVNLSAAVGVAVNEFPLKTGHGSADYLLFVNGKAVGVVEAKKVGTTLKGVEVQTEKYGTGLPDAVPAACRPLPFLYQSTGIETAFTNGLDPAPCSRTVFNFHRPETLARWLEAEPLFLPTIDGQPDPRSSQPSTLRSRFGAVPSVDERGLWPAQLKAVRNLEKSLRDNHQRALIQMATGSGKTFTAITAVYRLIKFADAKRVLFLVDRTNLGKQAEKEFQQYVAPDDGRKFTDLYNVQRLASNKVESVSRVVITTIQRLYSMLRGDEDLDPTLEEGSQFLTAAGLVTQPVPVVYNPTIPPEFFDIIVVDECHRSIYSTWGQVLDYFDAHLIGLTATPSKQTFGFFNQNLVMEYNHEQAVADGVNVDFDVYRIRTKISEQGATVEAEPFTAVRKRDRQTRAVRWQNLDEDLTYDAEELDKTVVTPDQIRTIIKTFKEKVRTEIFPGRTHVPKTLIYAKDDSHADDIVGIVREVFGKGNDFCEKITYRTGTARIVEKVVDANGIEHEVVTYKSTGVKPEDLLSSFRNRFDPRIVVTVDMIATGTDIRPLEVVMFMRAVKSRNFFEQMKGRGVRIINKDDLKNATPDAEAKTRFVIVDCVGVTEQPLSDTYSLEQHASIPFEKLLDAVAFGSTDPDILSSVAGRLARMARSLGEPDLAVIKQVSGGLTLGDIASGLVDALDPDNQADEARRREGLPADQEPSEGQLAKAAEVLLKQAAAPLATNPTLRTRLVEMRQALEQTIDIISVDELIAAGISPAGREKAKSLVGSFEQFIKDNKDEITALQVLYSQPHAARLKFTDIEALANLIQAPPRRWTPDLLWRAYEVLEQDRVRQASGRRLLTDIVSLVRFALHQEDALVPFKEKVEQRFKGWLLQQENQGKRFTEDQQRWLELMKDHIVGSVRVEMEDFDYSPFVEKGGAGKAYQVFGQELKPLIEQLNEVLAA